MNSKIFEKIEKMQENNPELFDKIQSNLANAINSVDYVCEPIYKIEDEKIQAFFIGIIEKFVNTLDEYRIK